VHKPKTRIEILLAQAAEEKKKEKYVEVSSMGDTISE